MLVLARKVSEQIICSDPSNPARTQIVITIVRIKGAVVRVGIAAPSNIRVRRAELTEPESESEQDVHVAEDSNESEETSNEEG